MADSDRMPKVDFKKDELKSSTIEYIKQVEKHNLARAGKIIKLRKSNLWTGALLGTAALGIYFYSFSAVKQETFLDDFNEPERITIG